MSHRIKTHLNHLQTLQNNRSVYCVWHAALSLCLLFFMDAYAFSQDYEEDIDASISNDSIIQDELDSEIENADEPVEAFSSSFVEESQKKMDAPQEKSSNSNYLQVKKNLFAVGLGRIGSWQSIWATYYERRIHPDWALAFQYGEGRIEKEGSYKDQIFSTHSKSKVLTITQRWSLRRLAGFAIRFQQNFIQHSSKSKRLSFLEDHPMALLESSKEEKQTNWNQFQLGFDISYRWELSKNWSLDYSILGVSWDIFQSILKNQNSSLKKEDPELHEWLRRQYAEPAMWGLINLSLAYKF